MERQEARTHTTSAGSLRRASGGRFRGTPRLSAALFICALAAAFLPGTAGATPPDTAGSPAPAAFPAPDLTPALKSRKLMPPALQHQLTHRERLLVEGFTKTAAPAAAAEVGRVLRTELDRQIRLLGGTPAFDDVVFQFGRIARLVYELNACGTYARSDGDNHFLVDFSVYAQRKTPKFVPVFYDYAAILFQDRDPDGYLTQVVQRNEDYTRRILQIYRQGGHSRMFDERSPAFGLASLQYSHTITDIANLWLFCWREANGDMAGTPFYPYRESTSSTEGRP